MLKCPSGNFAENLLAVLNELPDVEARIENERFVYFVADSSQLTYIEIAYNFMLLGYNSLPNGMNEVLLMIEELVTEENGIEELSKLSELSEMFKMPEIKKDDKIH